MALHQLVSRDQDTYSNSLGFLMVALVLVLLSCSHHRHGEMQGDREEDRQEERQEDKQEDRQEDTDHPTIERV